MEERFVALAASRTLTRGHWRTIPSQTRASCGRLLSVTQHLRHCLAYAVDKDPSSVFLSGPPLLGVALEGGTILSWFLGADIAHSFSPFFQGEHSLSLFPSHPHPWDSSLPLPQLSHRWQIWMLMDVGRTGTRFMVDRTGAANTPLTPSLLPTATQHIPK